METPKLRTVSVQVTTPNTKKEFRAIDKAFKKPSEKRPDSYTVSGYRSGGLEWIKIQKGSKSVSLLAPKHLSFQQAKWIELDGKLVLAAAFSNTNIKNSVITGFAIFTGITEIFENKPK